MSDRDSLLISQTQKLKPWHLLGLCAAFFANEISITFVLVYMVTLNRFLGLPLSYVSLPGVLSSTLSLALCPIMGRFGDGGNKHFRKSILVLVCSSIQALGGVLLITAFVLRQREQSTMDVDFRRNCKSVNPLMLSTLATSEISGMGRNSTEHDNHSRTDELERNFSLCNANETTSGTTSLTDRSMLPQVLGIIAFAAMDIGFDTFSSNVRAFLFETVDPAWHSSVLSSGIFVGGLGGITFGLLGLPNYASLLGEDTMFAIYWKALFLSIFLIVSVFLTMPLTIFFGWYLRRNKKTDNPSADTKKDGWQKPENSHIMKNGSVNNMSGHCLPYTEEDSFEHLEQIAKFLRRFLKSLSEGYMKLVKLSTTYLFTILVLVCLFTFMISSSVVSFEIYFTNFLAESVYGGSASAPTGSELSHKYNEGLTTASRGTIIFEATFFLYSFPHQKIVSKIGYGPEFLICNIVTMPLLFAFGLGKSVAVFYILTALNGVNRNLLLQTPFIVATESILMDKKNAQKDTSANTEGSQINSKDDAMYGTTVSAVWIMIPLSYLVISVVMGPLLETTDNPATPMYYSVITGVLASVVIIGFTLINRRR